MKAKVLIVVICLMAVACSKDKFNTKPSLTFEKMNGNTFYAGQTITITLRLTDREGDFPDTTDETSGRVYKKPCLYYQRASYICPDLIDTAVELYEVPSFPTQKDLDAFIDINYTYAISGQYTTLSGCSNSRDDSTYFKVWIKDAAGNVSDTVKTPVFTLLKN